LVPSRENSTIVALKSLNGTQNVSLDFLNEFKAYYECQFRRYNIEKY
ncbi:10708_t:CDS:2, partial [Scutellospora calospora]